MAKSNNDDERQVTKGNDITLHGKGNITNMLSANHVPEKPAMRGFDPKFSDLVDYIVRITHEIWEEGGVGLLYDYYGTNMTIHTSDGPLYGRDKVIEGTIQTLAAFPDRRLYADEVIWGGNDIDGFLSSHRLVHEGRNLGATVYGPPTGRKVRYRAVADCAVLNNVIYEEWLVRDELSLIYQLGFDIHETARRMAEKESDQLQKLFVPGEPSRLRGQLPPKPITPYPNGQFDIELFVKNSLHEIWNWRLFNKIQETHTTNFMCESASGRSLYGQGQYRTYVLSLLSPFPDLTLSFDHFCALKDGPDRYRTATRWTMQGTHTGPGIYGEPTGKQIRIIGVSHQIVENGRFTHEWTVFDEFALLKQIYRPD